MADKRVRRPDELEARIEALRAELVVSKQKQHDDMQADLLRVLDRTGDLAAALDWARRRVKRKPGMAPQAPDEQVGDDGSEA